VSGLVYRNLWFCLQGFQVCLKFIFFKTCYLIHCQDEYELLASELALLYPPEWPPFWNQWVKVGGISFFSVCMYYLGERGKFKYVCSMHGQKRKVGTSHVKWRPL